MQYLVINGPNLNLLGQREPDIYGSKTLSDLENNIKNYCNKSNINISMIQTNYEGEILDYIHTANKKYNGIVLNAGALTHYSYAIRDAIASIDIPVIEVHISNVYAREEFRHKSVLSPVVKGVICGFGELSYILAIKALENICCKEVK